MPRMGGYFPYNTTDVLHGGGALTLPPGGIFYPSRGNYIASTGNQTVIQQWNPIAGAWTVIGYTDQTMVPFTTDGSNVRLVNLSGVIVGAMISAAGSGGTNGIGAAATGVGVSIANSGATGSRAALAYPIVGGSVPAPTITTAGSAFLVPPMVVCDPPPAGGIQATFTCTLNNAGGIGSVTQATPGAGYAANGPPKFYIIPQSQFYQGATSGGVSAAPIMVPGLIDPTMVPSNTPAPGFNTANQSSSTPGALLTSNALTGSGTLTGIVPYDYGNLYTSVPAITITGCGAATATALGSFCLTGVTVTGGGTGFGAGNPPIWVSSIGLVLSPVNNMVSVPRPARGVTTLAAGVIQTAPIEDPGFGLQKLPVIGVLNTSAIATGAANLTPVIGGINDTSILQSMVTS